MILQAKKNFKFLLCSDFARDKASAFLCWSINIIYKRFTNIDDRVKNNVTLESSLNSSCWKLIKSRVKKIFKFWFHLYFARENPSVFFCRSISVISKSFTTLTLVFKIIWLLNCPPDSSHWTLIKSRVKKIFKVWFHLYFAR